MDRRLVIFVGVVCCLAILPDSSPQQLLSDSDQISTQPASLDAIRPYEFYKISVRWPKTECGIAPGCVTPAYFTIHGLWPHYKPDREVPPYNSTDPNRCTNVNPAPDTTITAAYLAPILTDMNHYWPSLTNPTITQNLNFWRHEWNKHGKCWDQPQQPIAYFRRALNFARQNSLVDIFRRAGIVPNNTRTYNRDEIAKAIQGSLGKFPEINCNRMNQLREIRVCYDPNRRIDCPTNFTSCTSQQLIFPEP